jgi:hypothetical protein
MFTVNVTGASAELPAALVANSVYVAADAATIGVPEITHVVADTVSPAGSVPLLSAHAVIEAPFAASVEGVTVIAVPAVTVVPVDEL